jgi:hypothetical protein
MAISKVKGLKSWLLDIFACHVLLANPNLDADDASNTVKVSAMITVCLPFLVILGSFVALYSRPDTLDNVKAIIVVSVLVIYFGISAVTDRVYDRNTLEIQERADRIMSDADQGLSWARGRLIKIYLGNILVMAVIVTVVKLSG